MLTPGDENCLYHALFWVFFGHPNFDACLRVLCVVTFLKNWRFFSRFCATLSHFSILPDLIKDTAIPFAGWGDVAHCQAAAILFGGTVHVYCKKQNVKVWDSYDLNAVIECRA